MQTEIVILQQSGFACLVCLFNLLSRNTYDCHVCNLPRYRVSWVLRGALRSLLSRLKMMGAAHQLSSDDDCSRVGAQCLHNAYPQIALCSAQRSNVDFNGAGTESHRRHGIFSLGRKFEKSTINQPLAALVDFRCAISLISQRSSARHVGGTRRRKREHRGLRHYALIRDR